MTEIFSKGEMRLLMDAHDLLDSIADNGLFRKVTGNSADPIAEARSFGNLKECCRSAKDRIYDVVIVAGVYFSDEASLAAMDEHTGG